jgi:hypothetical protein
MLDRVILDAAVPAEEMALPVGTNKADGNVSGSGFQTQGFQGLEKLYQGNISNIKTLDKSTVYYGWKDFVHTLQGIIDYEAEEISLIRLNHPETDKAINPGDHSDHRATGLAVQALPKYNKYHRFLYIGYDLWNYPVDLFAEDLFWKVG